MSNNSLKENTLILSLGTLISKGVQFVMIPLVSYWLTAEQYGMFDVLCTYITLLLPILSLTTGEAVFRFTASSENMKEKQEYITNGFLITTINFMLGLFVLAILNQMCCVGLNVSFLLLLFAQLYNYYLQAFLRAIKKLKIYTIANIITTLMIAIFTFLLVFLCKMELKGLIFAYAAGYLFGDIFIIIKTKLWKFIRYQFVNFLIMKKLVKYSLPLIPNDISWWVLSVSDRQIINIVLGAAANGIYAIANKVPSMCSSIFSTFSISWQQNVIERIEDENRAEYFNEIYNKIIVILLTICSGILSISFILFQYIFASKYAKGYYYVPVLLSAIIYASLMQFYGGIQIGLKNTYENGLTTVMGAVINLIVNIVFIKRFGLYAAAGSTLIANMSVAYMRRIRLQKIVHFKLLPKTYACLLIYIYFLICNYTTKNIMFMNWMNVFIAGFIFLFLNKEFISGFILHKSSR